MGITVADSSFNMNVHLCMDFLYNTREKWSIERMMYEGIQRGKLVFDLSFHLEMNGGREYRFIRKSGKRAGPWRKTVKTSAKL